jgi:hypothetical protein
MHTSNGRVFRYARATATALSAARVVQSPFQSPLLRSVPIDANVIAGSGIYVDLALKLTGTAAFTLNEFEDGLLLINDGNGEGYVYGVVSSSSLTPNGSTMRVYLDSKVQVTLLASSTSVSLLKNRYRDVELAKSSTYRTEIVGVTPVAVPASYYFWLATDGPCAVLQQDTLVRGLPVTASEITSGAVTLSRTVIPTGTEYRNLPHSAGGYAIVQTELHATDKESLTTITGLGVVPQVSIGTVLEPTQHGQHCMIQLGLDN